MARKKKKASTTNATQEEIIIEAGETDEEINNNNNNNNNNSQNENENENEEGVELEEIPRNANRDPDSDATDDDNDNDRDEGEGDGEVEAKMFDEEPAPKDKGLYPPPLRLMRSEKAGRYVVSTADIPKDVLIYIAKPFGVTIFDSHKKRFCRGCYTISDKNYSIHCNRCRQMWYCSTECLIRDRNYAHRFECSTIRRIASCKLQMYDVGTIRVLLHILAIREVEDEARRLAEENKEKETDKEEQGKEGKEEEEQKVDVWNQTSWSWDDFDSLCTNGPFIRQIEDKRQEAMELVRWVVKAIKASSEEKETPYNLRNTYSPNDIMDLLSKIESNAFNIAIISCKDPVGEAVFVSIAFINHSCDPNCEVIYSSDPGIPLCLWSRRFIPAGTELSIAYIDTDKTTQVRRSDLKDKYFFDCECVWCAANVDGRDQVTEEKTKTEGEGEEEEGEGEGEGEETESKEAKKTFKHKPRQRKKQKKLGRGAQKRAKKSGKKNKPKGV